MAVENRLSTALKAALSRNPDGTALIFNGRSYDWRWMAEQGRVLAGLLERAGVPDDAPIGIIPRNRALFIPALAELLRAGLAIVMIYAFQSAEALARDIAALRLAAVPGLERVDALPRTPSLKISLPGVLALFEDTA